MMLKERKKRVYTSMFDPFREDIEKWCDAGMSPKEAHAMLPAGYSYQGFYNYIRTKRIREGAWAREVDKRNICDKCQYCHKFLNRQGVYNNHENRICSKSWRVIAREVRHCPTWCELERGTAK